MKCSAIVWTLTTLLFGSASAATEPSQDIERVQMALARWQHINASSFTYDLEMGIGAPFGYGEFHVRVKDGKCVARHYAGGGLGRPKFVDRIRYHPCNGMLPEQLMSQVVDELSRGRQLKHFETHPEYGLALSVETDTDQLLDSSWGYDIKFFKLRGVRNGT